MHGPITSQLCFPLLKIYSFLCLVMLTHKIHQNYICVKSENFQGTLISKLSFSVRNQDQQQISGFQEKLVLLFSEFVRKIGCLAEEVPHNLIICSSEIFHFQIKASFCNQFGAIYFCTISFLFYIYKISVASQFRFWPTSLFPYCCKYYSLLLNLLSNLVQKN